MKYQCLRAFVLAALSLLLMACLSSAHDLWLVPGETISVGKPATVRINSGEDFPESEHAPDPATFARRLLVAPDGTPDALQAAGTEGKSGLVRFEPSRSGVYTLAVETRPKLITLESAAFNAYLVSDGLAHVYRLRAKEKTLDQPGKERYTKSPKALIRVGEGGGGDPCRVVGLPLEIVPLRDPFALKAGDTLRVRVLFGGKPLPEANLGWQYPGDGDTARGTVRSDAKGEALIPIERADLITVRLTHMTRPKAEGYEWESFWTSLTFRIPDGDSIAECLARVKQTHGGAGPWAVAGYRIGQRAQKELGLPWQSFSLLVTHYAPAKVQYSCVADGLQAATGASPGKLNLRVEEADLDQMRTVLEDRKTGRRLTFTLKPTFVRAVRDLPPEKLEAEGRRVAGLADDDIFGLVETKAAGGK